ncbi:MAG TPA: thiamine-phosphate kinase [Gemmatimonadaceae bacterium]|jgi:thiamine-monophosphate kinase|nr:thiamine-phosphate kinase [Gemmatimonadaceae bacterium]
MIDNMSGGQNIPLGPGKEFDLVRTLLRTWGKFAQRIGDDAAILDVPGEEKLVVSTDTSVEGVHFRRDWLNSFEIGYRATAAALSDLAAMAARPLGILIALTLPETEKEDAREIATGIREGASAVMCPIVGGDLSSGRELSLTITALGTTGRPLTRSGAKTGQRVYVTGRLGGPAAAVKAWRGGGQPSEAERARFACPIPRIDAALGLVARGASAGIDISDGLAADLAHIAAASRIGIEIDAQRIPRFDGVSAIEAAGSGEEYEIVVTAPEIDTTRFTEEFGLDLTEIGRVVAGPPRVSLLEGGKQIGIPPGYDHFSKK